MPVAIPTTRPFKNGSSTVETSLGNNTVGWGANGSGMSFYLQNLSAPYANNNVITDGSLIASSTGAAGNIGLNITCNVSGSSIQNLKVSGTANLGCVQPGGQFRRRLGSGLSGQGDSRFGHDFGSDERYTNVHNYYRPPERLHHRKWYSMGAAAEHGRDHSLDGEAFLALSVSERMQRCGRSGESIVNFSLRLWTKQPNGMLGRRRGRSDLMLSFG